MRNNDHKAMHSIHAQILATEHENLLIFANWEHLPCNMWCSLHQSQPK